MVDTFFTEKRIIKKIIIAIVFIFMFNFTFSYLGNNVVFADESDGSAETTTIDDETALEEGGGKLLLPIHSLVLWVADAILELMQNSFYTQESIIQKAKSEEMSSFNTGALVLCVVGVVVVTLATIYTCGATLAAAPTVTGAMAGATTAGTSAAVAGITAAGTVAGQIAGGIVVSSVATAVVIASGDAFIDQIRGEYDLPMIFYTPEAIFSNRIPLFNINFFNPGEDRVETITDEIHVDYLVSNATDIEYIINQSTNTVLAEAGYRETPSGENTDVQIINTVCNDVDFRYYTSVDPKEFQLSNGKTYNQFVEMDTIYLYEDGEESSLHIESFADGNFEDAKERFRIWCIDNIATTETSSEFDTKREEYAQLLRLKFDELNNNIHDAIGIVSVEISFEGINLVLEYNPISLTYSLLDNSASREIETDRVVYESSSAILQSTVSSMYKTLRTVAIVALMSILVYVGIRMVLSSTSKDKAKYKQMLIDWLVAFIMLFVLHYVMAFIIDISEKLTEICNKSNVENLQIEIPAGTRLYDKESGEWQDAPGANTQGNRLKWGTNFIGMIRYYAGLVQQKGYTLKGVSYTLMYVVLVIYIVMFTFQYMRRVLYMAFLTMISPLVAITYPLDKINDGKAQGFSMWLREYIFNALLQPIHYIIYVIIMGSVMDLVVDHPVYALVALGFMVPAEKFIRKMFGFEKAGTVGAFGGAAGAAMLMSGVQRLTHKPHGKKSDDNGAKGEQDSQDVKVRTISSIPKGPETSTTDTGRGASGGNIIPRPGDSNFIGPILPREGDLNFIGPLRPPQTPNNESPNVIDPTSPGGENPASIVTPRPPQTPNNEPPNFIDPTSPREGNPSFIVTPRPTPSSPEPSNQRPNLFNRAKGVVKRIGNSSIGQGVKTVGGHYTRRLDNRLRKSHPLRTIRRGLTYGAGALALGTIGLAAGIASGDPSKALQYTMAGGIAGGNLGRNLGETASNAIGLEGAVKSFKAGALGNKNSDLERAKYKQNFKNNVSNYDAGVRNVTTKGWKEMSKDNGIIDTGLDYGISNVDDLSKIYLTQQKFMQDYNMEEEEAKDLAFKAYKLDSQFGDYSSNSKTQENLDKLLEAKGWTDDDERERIKQGMLNTMKVYQKVSLDEGIEEPEFDYTRMSNQEDDQLNPPSGEPSDLQSGSTQRRNRPMNMQFFADKKANTTKEDLNEDSEDDIRNKFVNNQSPQIPITNEQMKKDQFAEADAAVARAEADKKAKEQERANITQKEENEKIKKELSNRAKADKSAEKKAKKQDDRKKAEENRARHQEKIDRNKRIAEDNNVINGEQGDFVSNQVETKRGRESNREKRDSKNTGRSNIKMNNNNNVISSTNNKESFSPITSDERKTNIDPIQPK